MEHVGLCPSKWVPPDDNLKQVARKEIRMDVVFDRVAGLDIGKATVTVCVRTPGPGGKRKYRRGPSAP